MPTFTLRSLLFGLCCLTASRVSAQQYTLTELGTFGGDFSSAVAINAVGQVVGAAHDPQGASHPFILENGTMRDLGLLPGSAYCGATSINDLGHVVGICFDADLQVSEGFLWTLEDGLRSLGTPLNAEPYHINNSDVVVGATYRTGSLVHAFSFHDGVYTDLGAGRAFGINDAGQIVGVGPDLGHAVMWDASGRHDLGPSERESFARAISPGGLPVGSVDLERGGFTVAAAFYGDGIANLGTLGGTYAQASAVRAGLIVGSSVNARGAQRAFLYDLNGSGTMIDLNDRVTKSDWTLAAAYDVNADGAIVAFGSRGTSSRGFLLTPTGNPAPSTNLLVAGGFEAYAPPQLGAPGWISDDLRQVPAKSETNQPRSGEKNGACWTTDNLDCGLFQDVTAPASGTYTLTIYANSDRPGALVGANVGDETVVSADVAVRGFANYGDAYVLTFHATQGQRIRVWMYSPAVPGYLVIDDVVLTRPTT